MKKMDKGLIITLIITVFIIIAFIIFLFLRSDSDRISENEHEAFMALLELNKKMNVIKNCNYQARNYKYPQGYGPGTNSGKLCALYFEVNNSGQRIMLIDKALAQADCRADGNTAGNDEGIGSYIPVIVKDNNSKSYLSPVTFKMKPYHGYWFALCEGREIHQYDNTFSKNFYAIIAFPADYGKTGKQTYLINEEGKIYHLDFGKGVFRNYPGPDIFDLDDYYGKYDKIMEKLKEED